MPPFLRGIERALTGLKKLTRDPNDGYLTPPFSPMAEPGITRTSMPSVAPPLGDAGAISPPASMPAMPELDRVPIPRLPGQTGAPRPADPITAAEYEYVSGRPNSSNVKGFGARLKSALLPAGLGLLQGAAASPNDPLRGAIGGAATAGILGAANPTMGRQYEFALLKQPGIEAEQQRARTAKAQEVEDALARGRIADQQVDTNYKIAQTEATRARMRTEAENAMRRAEPKPISVGPGQTIVNPVTGKPIFTAPDKPAPVAQQRKQAEDAIRAQFNVEKIARDSVAGDSEGVKRYMPARYYDIVSGRIASDDPEEVVKAQQALGKAQQQLYQEKLKGAQSDLDRRIAEARAGASSAPAGTKPAQSRGSGPTRKLSDLKNLLFKR